MQFNLGDFEVNIQAVPLYGVVCGINYWNPNLDPDLNEEVNEEDYYEDVTLLFFLFAIKITWWK